ncbi:NAD(P)-binding Rossmann-fold containing protein [Glarea lozoyensis ATCC 20868]|uniref:NAD(P)-binding Rossmann-fold containing protein n=1 Tax=Glarea lozoyensis (strain ATCC 20868 / MF5171) TaxID=1116229 RepID=S3D4I1_GLAL2|nr:NAD(P)-binding Rossmann-fold containing protein [Glarea lozoyensis ATCC 20868]EPE26986.1 NAD(P)-binding Rossmann-fold containing protein [Glarea lozoyensis ATCC 20868]
MPTTYLITGANRGLGHGLAASLLLREDHIIIGVIRTEETASALKNLPRHPTSDLIVLSIPFNAQSISSSEENYRTAFSTLSKTYPTIDHIDIVIANAGISECHARVLETPAVAVAEHMAVNSIAPLILFQNTWPLLSVSANPRFVYVSSMGGSIHNVPETSKFASLAYGMGKAGGNYLTKKICAENSALSVLSVHPGWIQTDLGNGRARAQGFKQAPVTVNTSVEGLLLEVNSAQLEAD